MWMANHVAVTTRIARLAINRNVSSLVENLNERDAYATSTCIVR